MKKRADKFRDDIDFHEKRHHPNSTPMERALTPGQTANNVVKTTATAIITAGTVLLMGGYGIAHFFGADISPSLPLATLAASAVSTACVWIFGRPKADALYGSEINKLRREMHTMAEDIDKLQERIINAEYIESFEERLARKELGSKLQSPPPLQSDIPTHSVSSPSESMPSAPTSHT